MNEQTVFISKVVKPERKMLVKRGKKAKEYFEYCEEVGCDVWNFLKSFPQGVAEPECLWLPEKYVKPGTPEYVQGVEVATEFFGELPEGFDLIELPESLYLVFKGPEFKEEDYVDAIRNVQQAIAEFDYAAHGLKVNPESPRIQLEPIGTRGYIELVPVLSIF